MACRKVRYESREEARLAAVRYHQKFFDVRRFNAYRCQRCRAPDGKRMWHWGHSRFRKP